MILTQDLDFLGIIALSGHSQPSLIFLRWGSSRVERVNAVERALPEVEADLGAGAIVAVHDTGWRVRRLPMKA